MDETTLTGQVRPFLVVIIKRRFPKKSNYAIDHDSAFE
jgi:hypothetical protein